MRYTSARLILGATSPTDFRSIQVWHLYIILYFVMLLSECFTKVVYPHVRNHQFPTFIVLTDTSKHAQQIGDALLHHLTCNDTWPDLIQYDDMHTPDILTTLWPTGKYNKQLLNVPKLLTFHHYSASNQDTVEWLPPSDPFYSAPQHLFRMVASVRPLLFCTPSPQNGCLRPTPFIMYPPHHTDTLIIHYTLP